MFGPWVVVVKVDSQVVELEHWEHNLVVELRDSPAASVDSPAVSVDSQPVRNNLVVLEDNQVVLVDNFELGDSQAALGNQILVLQLMDPFLTKLCSIEPSSSCLLSLQIATALCIIYYFF
jgi:hypothetical protein